MTTAQRPTVAEVDRWLADERVRLGQVRKARRCRQELEQVAWHTIDGLLDMRNAADR